MEWTGAHYDVLGANWNRSNLQLVWDFIQPVPQGDYVWDNIKKTEQAFDGASKAGVHYLAVFHEGGLIDPELRHQLDNKLQYQQFV